MDCLLLLSIVFIVLLSLQGCCKQQVLAEGFANHTDAFLSCGIECGLCLPETQTYEEFVEQQIILCSKLVTIRLYINALLLSVMLLIVEITFMVLCYQINTTA
jgi:hypothetical protein